MRASAVMAALGCAVIANPVQAEDIRGRNIDLVYGGAVRTVIRILKDGRVFIAAQGRDPNCNSAGIATHLDRPNAYVMRCRNQRPGDPPMRGTASARFDGSTLRVTSREEFGRSLFFENDWAIRIAGRTCSGSVNMNSHAGPITHAITACRVS